MSRFALHNRRPARFRPLRKPRRRPLRAAFVVTVLLPFAVPALSEANPGVYRVHVCSTPDDNPVPFGTEWKPYTYSGPGPTSQQNAFAWHSCDKPRGSFALALNSFAADIPVGAVASWSLTVPEPLRLVGALVRRKVNPDPHPRDDRAIPEYTMSVSESNVVGRSTTAGMAAAAAGGRTIESCAANGCKLGHPWSAFDSPDNFFAFPVAPTTSWSFSVKCASVDSTYGGSCALHDAPRIKAEVGRIELLVSDPNPPVATSEVTGTAVAVGEQSGLRSLSASAQDHGSGLREISLSIDGKVVDRAGDLHGGSCKDAGFATDDDYASLVPCKRSDMQVSLGLDSRKFADGPHKLTVVARDASGLGRVLRETEVTFENYPAPKNLDPPTVVEPTGGPRPNDVLAATVGNWEGSGGTPVATSVHWEGSLDGNSWEAIRGATGHKYTVKRENLTHFLRAVVVATNAEGATRAVSNRVGPVQTGATVAPAGFGDGTEPAGSNGAGGDPSTAQLVVDREQRTVAVKHGAKIVVTGRLVDADGQPIANADVDVFEQLVLTAAPWAKIGSVKTDSQGGYVFRPKTTASRRLRFAFADQRDAANYRATREVLVEVQGGMTISAKRKVLSPGSTIRLSGRLTVDQLPKSGTWVEVQVLDAGVWRTIATRKTSSKGLWTFKHRLRQSSGITFRFRSRLRPVGDVASAETKSSTLKVRVR